MSTYLHHHGLNSPTLDPPRPPLDLPRTKPYQALLQQASVAAPDKAEARALQLQPYTCDIP